MCRILVADGMNKEQIENLKELGFDVIDEYYDGEDTHRYYLDESEQMMTDIRNFLNN